MTNRTLPSDLTDLLAAQVGEVDSTFDVEDPATGEVLVTVPDRSAADALDALGRAVDAQKIWEKVPPQPARGREPGCRPGPRGARGVPTGPRNGVAGRSLRAGPSRPRTVEPGCRPHSVRPRRQPAPRRHGG